MKNSNKEKSVNAYLERINKSKTQKRCSKCGKVKIKEIEFYVCMNRYRSECKECTIARNSKYQSDTQSWKKRDPEKWKQYMREYYKNHSRKFEYYRARFKKIRPTYWSDYYQTKVKKELTDD